MQVSVENTGKLGRRMTVNVPAERIDGQVTQRLRQLSKQVKIKGFRPGRIPIKVIQQRYGRQVRREIIGQLMQDSFQEALRSEAIQIAGIPKVDPNPDSLISGDLEFTAEFEVFPEIGETDVSSMEIVRKQAEITAADVDQMLLTLQRQRADWRPTDQAASEGDLVTLGYSANTGEHRYPQEGVERLTVIIGANNIFSEFEQALLAASAGDIKAVELKFPDNFHEPLLAGANAQVEISVETVESPELPSIDAEFAQSFGVENGDVDVLRSEVRQNLERELQAALTSLLKIEVTNKLLSSRADLKVPEALVNEEAANLRGHAMERQRQAGVENPVEQPLENFMDSARRRVSAGLLMGEIARTKGLELDKDRVRQSVETIAATFEQPSQVVELYYGNPRLLDGVENAVLEEQVVDWVLENANVSDQPMAFQEVMTEASSYS